MTCIAVIGPHRSGTSAVAGVLYHLGVPMGDDLIGPGRGNPTGHFEDREFVDLHDLIIGDWKNPRVDFEPYRETYTSLIRRREKQYEVWGLKDPRMCFVLPYFVEIAQNTRVISVCRDRDLCTESLVRRGGHTQEEAIEISKRYALARKNALASITVPVHAVRYEALIDHSDLTVSTIACFVDLEPAQEAIDFIDPTLCHHKG